MSQDGWIALGVAVGGLCVSCITGGVYFGILKGKVDTLQRDVNHAFRMLREIQNKE